MSERDDLLRGIREHPEDDAPRLVFADWLDDTSGARVGTSAAKEREWAATIRREVEAARTPRTDPRYWELHAWPDEKPASRAVALLPEVFRNHARYERGFPDGLRLASTRFARLADTIATALAPLYRLEVPFVTDTLGELVQHAALARFRRLRCLGGVASLASVTAFADSPRLANLAALDLALPMRPESIAAILRSPYLMGLRELSLRGPLSTISLRPLIDAPSPRPLERLWIQDNVRVDALPTLLTGPAFGNLRELAFQSANVREPFAAVLASGALPHLNTLRVSATLAEDSAFFRSACFRRLTELEFYGSLRAPWLDVPEEAGPPTLSLTCQPWDAADSDALMRSPIISRCLRLTLPDLSLTPGDLLTLAGSPFARHLRVLRVGRVSPSFCSLTGEVMSAFADSPNLANLHELELGGEAMTPEGLRALTRGTFADSLRALCLGWCPDTLDGELSRLADSEVFPKLRVLDLHGVDVRLHR